MATTEETVAVDVPKTEEAPELAQSEHTYKYKVKMTCSGCSGAVTRVLKRAQDEGQVSEFDVNLEQQSVFVKGPIGFEELTTKISKTGKQILESEEVKPESAVESTPQVAVAA